MTTDDERYENGLNKRRQILGDAWVERSLKNATPFNAEFQNLITRHAWGDLWQRGGLDDQTRRFLVLAQMIALNRPDEFKLHFRAAIEAGVPLDLLREVLMQSAVYCGVPAANSAFHWAAEVLAETTP